jgi:glycosyltransferase involved in cell wall biosynthesis
MRIAILSDGVAPYVMGGIQRHTRMLAIHMVRAGAEITLFHTTHGPKSVDAQANSLHDFPSDVVDCIQNIIVEYPQQGWLPGHYLRDSRGYSERLLQRYLCDQIKADFIYAQGLTGLAFTAARQKSPELLPPIGVNQHGYEMFQRAADVKTYLQHLMLRGTFARLARQADWVFAFPARIRDIVENKCGVPAARIIQIPNAIDQSWIVGDRPMPPEKRRFVFVGRHERRKGVPELVNAIATLPYDGWEFHFVGPIPAESRIADENVIYHGAVSDTGELQRILDAGDVLVCPSFAEGMPTVVLEAMARGLAIIATDVGATAEWVDDTNGLLLPSPSASDLAAAIRTFLAMPSSELHRLQMASLAKARNYKWGGVAESLVKVIAAHALNCAADKTLLSNQSEPFVNGH